MIATVNLALFLGFWASLYLIDAYLKTHRYLSDRYLHLLNKTGLAVSVGQVRWYTNFLNRLFMRIGQWHPAFLRMWFTCGVYFGLLSMVMSVCILTLLVINTLQSQPVEQQVLTPVMPGVNLPMSQMTYYLLTLLVCGVLHEMGHAIAAVREQVRVNGFGLFIFAIYPGAYVDLCTEHLQMISPMRQLRIYCAGVWHNFVIVMVALGALMLFPWLLLPFYHTGKAIIVTDVAENSAVSGPRGLFPGDQVTHINDCRVTNIGEWTRCISASLQEQSSGFCISLEQLQHQDISPYSYPTAMGNVECCSNTTNTHLCFSYFARASPTQKYACLPARSTTERPPCKLPSDCYNPSMPATCAIPSLDNSTKLLRVIRSGRLPLLFLGHPLDLHYAVRLSIYVPYTSIIPLYLPYVIETFCKYLISLSGALALLNVVPCYALDGQFILTAFLEMVLRSVVTNVETRRNIYALILLFGTLLLTMNVCIAMWSLFR